MNDRFASINFHLFKPCDARCRFCFASFRDVRGRLSAGEARRLLDQLRAAGGEKLNFAGGEPTLHPHIGELIRHAHDIGFVTSIVTNGSRLARLLDDSADALDWAALSIDSGDEATQERLGRGQGDHVARCIALADRCRDADVRLKVNTVVTKMNWHEDLSPLIQRLAPERWKVFQVLRVTGQNDGVVEPLLISASQFEAFIARHAPLGALGFPPVAEDNDAMIDTYVMVDPLGRFFGNTDGVHRTSAPILEVGVPAAAAAMEFDAAGFEARGGRYDWRQSEDGHDTIGKIRPHTAGKAA